MNIEEMQDGALASTVTSHQEGHGFLSDQSLSVWSLVLCKCSHFLPQSKDVCVRLIGSSHEC